MTGSVAWLRGDTADALETDFAALAGPLGLPEIADQGDAVAAVRHALSAAAATPIGAWLLVVDNVEDLDVLDRVLPERHYGNVLVTTRHDDHRGTGLGIAVEPLPPADAVDYLTRQAGITAEDATQVADALGGLPLALVQAGATITKGMAARTYLDLLATRAPDLFSHGRPADYDHTLVTTWEISYTQLAQTPGAQALLRLCAFLAPDAIPLDDLARPWTEHEPARSGLPEDLAQAFTDQFAVLTATAALNDTGLAAVVDGRATIHRLVQQITRSRLEAALTAEWCQAAITVVLQAFPGEAATPTNWDRCELLLPHAETAASHLPHDLTDDLLAPAVDLFTRAATYLHTRGRDTHARGLAEHAVALATINAAVDAPAPGTLLAARHALADALFGLGDWPAARALQERVYTDRVKLLGADDPATLATGRQLVQTLHLQGERRDAAALLNQLITAHTRALPPQHPDTLTAHAYHATILQAQGDLPQARTLTEQVLTTRERVLGPDHPGTLRARNNLAGILWEMRERREAIKELLATAQTAKRTLGERHPDTTNYLFNLANFHMQIGNPRAAQTVIARHLAWLRKAPDASLSGRQRQIKAEIGRLGRHTRNR
ncbi:MAG: tetratricopeptide repeat protein [Kineosporiaceae bacterium]